MGTAGYMAPEQAQGQKSITVPTFSDSALFLTRWPPAAARSVATTFAEASARSYRRSRNRWRQGYPTFQPSCSASSAIVEGQGDALQTPGDLVLDLRVPLRGVESANVESVDGPPKALQAGEARLSPALVGALLLVTAADVYIASRGLQLAVSEPSIEDVGGRVLYGVSASPDSTFRASHTPAHREYGELDLDDTW